MRLEPENPEAWRRDIESARAGEKVYLAEETSRGIVRQYRKSIDDSGTVTFRQRIDQLPSGSMKRTISETVLMDDEPSDRLMIYSLSEKESGDLLKKATLTESLRGNSLFELDLYLPRRDFRRLGVYYSKENLFKSFVLYYAPQEELGDFFARSLAENLRNLLWVFAIDGEKVFTDPFNNPESNLLRAIKFGDFEKVDLGTVLSNNIKRRDNQGWKEKDQKLASKEVSEIVFGLVEAAREEMQNGISAPEEEIIPYLWITQGVLEGLPDNYPSILQSERQDVINKTIKETVAVFLRNHYSYLQTKGMFSVDCSVDQQGGFKLSFEDDPEKEFHSTSVTSGEAYSFDGYSYTIGREGEYLSLRVASSRRSNLGFKVKFAEKVDPDQFKRLILSEDSHDWQRGSELFRTDYKEDL